MKLLLVADGHYLKTKDGKIYAESVYGYDFYKRYLGVFDHIYAIIRVKLVDELKGNENLCSGEGITFLELPEYRGPIEYIKKYLLLRRMIKNMIHIGDCAIFRLPGATANLVANCYCKTGRPFGIEVVVDPWENFAPKSIKSPLRPLVRVYWTLHLKRMCYLATGVSYVTKKYLQERYPNRAMRNKKGYFQSYYSSVELPDECFGRPKVYDEHQSHFTISHSSNLYTGFGKGHLPLIRALELVRNDGYDVEVEFVGDGPLRSEFEKYALEHNVSKYVHFKGRVSGSAEVREIIKNSDLFVFPTRAEGLPRVLLEAMAEGLPCISSPTCGIPEILDKKFLCEYDDEKALARIIEDLINNPKLMQRESIRNLQTAREYSKSILSKRRNEFYRNLKQSVEDGRLV